ncbi:TetR/AcrR family transcriptional regulator [Peptoniphilus timonensis]|uniref:TetR/AcrR family transcriptional regulator n=1 Tax=Peptoniphilus timonensis TaxID=1268254 RepID=UPI0006843B90|nr:TetR/AcrR family transcriptional regulator [Peptoniphilus timonensis]
MDSFRDKGIEVTSIRDIMNRTDFGLGTFYLYFRDKKDLEQKIVLDILTELFYEAESTCKGSDPKKRYISFINYIIDYLMKDPLELQLISNNLNWALYAKIENDDRYKEVENSLQFILNKYSNLFNDELSDSERLFVLSLTMHIVLTTCESALMEDSILGIDDMKPALYKIVERIFR